jgi:TPR repeat protein
MLGLKYERGIGLPQSFDDAAKWFRKAADQGLASAQNDLGFLYGQGRGVPKDLVKAYMWFDLSALQFYPNAAETRDLMAAQMTPSQIAEAQLTAREWKPKYGLIAGEWPPAAAGNLPLHGS